MTEEPSQCARDLMIASFREISAEESLRIAMDALVEIQSEPELPNALVVVDPDGNYVGLLTASLLLRSLLTLWMPSKSSLVSDAFLEKELLEVARERSRATVRDCLIHGVPTATPDDRILALIALSCEHSMEFVPVLDNRRAVGLVPTTRIFQRAASLALTPDDEGIRLDGKTFK